MDLCGDVQFPIGNFLREKIHETAMRTTVLLFFLFVDGHDLNEKRLGNATLFRPSPRVGGEMEFRGRDHQGAGAAQPAGRKPGTVRRSILNHLNALAKVRMFHLCLPCLRFRCKYGPSWRPGSTTSVPVKSSACRRI